LGLETDCAIAEKLARTPGGVQNKGGSPGVRLMIQIRVPRALDKDEWARMRRVLWPDCPDDEHFAEIGAFLQTSDDAGPASCRYSVGKTAAWVADDPAGGLCGFLEASIRPYAEGSTAQPVGYVERWYVDPGTRRHGVGRALVAAAEAWARSLGCRQMASDASIDNGVSIEAHVAIGYREVARAVHFSKELRSPITPKDEVHPVNDPEVDARSGVAGSGA
jgi:aminoglycoside 6'-N-acetyltransferase I